jgi:hypothetical protein
MAWKIIPIDNPGNDLVYGGDDTKKLMKYHAGYDLTLEDTSDKVEIDTPTYFRTDKFRIKSPTTGYSYIFRSQNIDKDIILSLPLTSTDGTFSLASTNAINDWGDNLQTFRHQKLRILNPLATFGYLINTSAITTNINASLPQLTADDTFVFANATQVLTNKTLSSPTINAMTINTDANTIKHSTTNNAGDLMVNTGSKFDRLARGTANQVPIMNPTGTGLIWVDKSSLGGSGGGGGGSTTSDYAIPAAGNVITGAWFGTTTAGGSGVWTEYLTSVNNVTPTDISDGTGRMGLRWNFTSDDDRGGFRTNNHHFYRQNDPELWVRWRYDPLAATHTSSTNYRVVIGFTNDVSGDYGSDGALANKSCFMWFKETADTVTLVGRNDGDATQDKDSTQVSLSQTSNTVHTIRLFGDNTNSRFGISLDGANAVYYTSEIPAATTRLGCIVQFENEGSDDRSFEILGAYFKAKVI